METLFPVYASVQKTATHILKLKAIYKALSPYQLLVFLFAHYLFRNFTSIQLQNFRVIFICTPYCTKNAFAQTYSYNPCLIQPDFSDFSPKLITSFSAKHFQTSSLYTVVKTENIAFCTAAHKQNTTICTLAHKNFSFLN